MSNVLSRFVLKLTILIARFVPFFWSNYLHANVDFPMISKWGSFANFASTPTCKWWYTIVSIDFHFP
jgi:hypothetical protein